MKQNLKIIIFIIIIILIATSFFIFKTKKENETLRSIEEKIIYFYGQGCPHCANVEKFFEENDIKSKIQFEEREIYSNKENANLLMLIARKKCNLSRDEIGVPFLWDGSKCLVGDQNIINFFQQKVSQS